MSVLMYRKDIQKLHQEALLYNVDVRGCISVMNLNLPQKRQRYNNDVVFELTPRSNIIKRLKPE